MREHLLLFPPFRLDLPNARLYKDHDTLPLQRKELTLLWYLASQAGRLIPHDELLRAVWPGVTVSPGVLKVRIRRIRQVLGDNANTPRFIENVHGQGYRFIAAVTPQPVQSSKFKVSSSSPLPTSDISRKKAPSAQLGTWNLEPGTLLVGRDAELAQLHEWFEKAASGERQLVFVTGEPGIGKTTLVEGFLRRLRSEEQEENQKAKIKTDPRCPLPVAWIAQGQCIEQYGTGEPYLPVLDALGRLARTREKEALTPVLAHYAPTWLAHLPALLSTTELQALQPRISGASRERMLREFADAIEALTNGGAVHEPPLLVLVLEDLHWADASTIELLAMLARRPELARLLVLGTYRPSEVLGDQHPLSRFVHELFAHGRGHELALSFLSEADIDAYLQQRFPQRLFPTRFAEFLHRHTDGNPLFIMGLLNELLAQGLLSQQDGQWIVHGSPEQLLISTPQNIRHLVTRQRERLPVEDRRVLEAASIAGMEFSVAAVAAALETEVVATGGRCAELAERQQFLRPAGVAEWPDGTVAARYGFIHALYQHLWHEQVPIERRQQWHLRIGARKALAYGAHTSEIASELAVHFEQGRDYQRAVTYLHQAGETAVRRSSSAEAIEHFTKGLELLKTLPETPERAQKELTVQVSLGPVLMMTNGRSAAIVEQAYTRALTLCQQTGEHTQLFSALRGLWECYETRGEFQKAHELAEQFFREAQAEHNPARLLVAHDACGDTLFWRGEFVLARTHLTQGVALYDPQQHSFLAFFHGGYDPGIACACLGACVAWLLGYADQAQTQMDAALALARRLGHLHSQASALIWSAVLHQLRREPSLVRTHAEETIPLCRAQGFPYYLAAGMIMQGWALTEEGQEEGVTPLQHGLATCRALGVEMARTYFLGLLAQAHSQTGRVDAGLNALDEAFTLVHTNGERLCEAELWRLKGELLLARGRINPQPPTLNADVAFAKGRSAER